jgi:hypothetical protein
VTCVAGFFPSLGALFEKLSKKFASDFFSQASDQKEELCTSASRAHPLFCLSFRVWRMLLFVVFNDFIDDHVLDSEDVSDQRRGPLPLCQILFL